MNTRREYRALFLQVEGQGSALRGLDVCPNRPFQPIALILWGTTPETFIRQVRIGWETQFERPMPGFEFESDIPYDEFEGLLTGRADLLMPAIERLHELGMFHRWDFPPVDEGKRIELTVEGPFERGVFIGFVPRIEKAA